MGDCEITGESYVAPTCLGNVHLWFQKRTAPLTSWYPAEFAQYLQAEFIGSVSKNVSFSEVLVEFIELRDTTPIGSVANPDPRSAALPTAVIEGLNAFLRYYRINNIKYYIPRVTDHTITIFGLFEQHENGTTSNNLLHRLFERSIPFENTIGDSEEQKIRQALKTGERNYIHELYSEVWNKLALQDWRLAIIDSIVLLEAWLTPYLKEAYRQKGLSNSVIKEKFKTGEKHYPMGISEICQTLIEDATGYAFQGVPQHEELVQRAINPRNKLVHGTKLVATGDEAYKCIHSVIAAVALINAVPKINAFLAGHPVGTSDTVQTPEIPHPLYDCSAFR